MSKPASSHKIPSVDPEMDQAVDDLIEDSDKYFASRRALRREEAAEYVRKELAQAAARRKSL